MKKGIADLNAIEYDDFKGITMSSEGATGVMFVETGKGNFVVKTTIIDDS